MHTKIVVRHYDGQIHEEDFDNVDEAMAKYKELEQNKNVKMADLEVETITKLKSFVR